MKDKFLENVREYSVILFFTVLIVVGFFISGMKLDFFMDELLRRIVRNSLLVVSLIIPVIAGLGLNFGIVVGAMAGQMGLFLVTYYDITGFTGILIAALIATPLAILFGYLTGSLYNNTKGQEMVTGLILGLFADGVYMFIFLILIGGIIPVPAEHRMIKPDGVGLRNTVALSTDDSIGVKYAIDNLLYINVWMLIIAVSAVFIAYCVYKYSKEKQKGILYKCIFPAICILVSLFVYYSGLVYSLAILEVPVVTILIVVACCIFTNLIFKTKLGQDFKAIGQNQHIATVSGIDVDKTRIIAIIISTVMAAWGQIILLQNIGTINTYGSHKQVGFFAIASILIGGATVAKATVRQALIGTLLFHCL